MHAFEVPDLASGIKCCISLNVLQLCTILVCIAEHGVDFLVEVTHCGHFDTLSVCCWLGLGF